MRRSRHDREILRLAVPALGALAAEPLYLLRRDPHRRGLMAVRLVTTGARFARRRWVLVAAPA